MKALMLPIVAAAVVAAAPAYATGKAKCEAGPKESWQPQATLEQKLSSQGWKVQRVKVDGGCYEVYGLDEKGKRVEVYFHPKTLERVPTK
jgi:hypothetical protein